MLDSPETSVSEAQNYKPQQTLHKKEHHYKSIQISQCNLTNKIRCICRFDVDQLIVMKSSESFQQNNKNKSFRLELHPMVPGSTSDERKVQRFYMQTCNRFLVFIYLFIT